MSKAMPRMSIIFKILAFILMLLGIWIIYSAYASSVETIHKYLAYFIGMLIVIPSIAVMIMQIKEE